MRLFVLVWACLGVAHADRGRNTVARRAAIECERMPPSLNPWGAACAEMIGARWTSCERAHAGHPAALDDCLGFLTPPSPVPDGVIRLRVAPLREWSVSQCHKLHHESPAHCPDEVTERFERCGLAALFSLKDFAVKPLLRCLGFQVPRAMPELPTQMVRCEKPRVPISYKIARETEWPGSERRVLQGRTLYVARTPFLDEHDAKYLTVAQMGGWRHAILQLKDEALLKLGRTTEANRGQYAVVETGDWILILEIDSAVWGLSLGLDPGPVDLCR